MKWLIVAPEIQKKDAELIKELLESYKSEAVFFFITDKMKNAYLVNNEDKNLMLSKVELLKANSLFDGISHLIILDAAKSLMYHPVSFISGYMIGSQMPVLLSGISDNKGLPSVFSACSVFSSISEISTFFGEHFSEYIAEEQKNNAHKKLFDLGIPFTPDCFSFHIAKNNTEECEMFLKAGMDVNSRDSAGTPMISMATRHEKLDMIKWLTDNGADINVISTDRGYTPVMDAVWKSNYDIANYFVLAGAKLDIVSRDGQSILVLAVGTGNERICKLLATHGADPLIKDAMGMSALDYAKLFKKQSLVSLFEECLNNEKK